VVSIGQPPDSRKLGKRVELKGGAIMEVQDG
jgi:hypothetical protein